MKRACVSNIMAGVLSLLTLYEAALAQELVPLPTSRSNLPFWEPTNGPTGAYVGSLARGTSGTIIAATYGGTYRSTNSGGLWELIGPIAGVASCGGTSFFVGSNGQGVSRSTDDGRHWTNVSGVNPHVRDLAATPDGSVFAATETNEPGVIYKGEIYYLAGGSTNWSKVYPPGGVPSEVVVRVAIDSSGHLLFSSQYGYLLHSPDTGKTYSRHSDVEATEVLQVGSDGTVFGAGRRGVFRSTDHGLSWTQVNAGLTDTSVYALAIRDGGNVIAGTSSGVFGSTDMGSTWTLRSAAVTNVCAMAWLSDQELLAGTLGGVSRSTDSGLTWRNVNCGMGADYVTALGIDPRGRLYAGVRGSAYRTADRGESWSRVLTTVNAWPTWFCFKDTLLGFATGNSGGVLRSTDGGNTWSPANTGLTDAPARTVGVTSLGTIILGTWGDGVYRSTNDGETWSHLPTGADTVVTAFARVSGGAVLLGAQGAVLISIDDGITWLPCRWGLPAARVSGIIEGGLGLFFAGLDDGGVFRSTDNGASWTPCNAGFPPSGMHVYSMDANRMGHLLVAGSEGIYRSTNSGDSWEALNAGLPITLTPAIAVDPTGYAYAGTGGAGVWRSASPTVVSVREDRPQISEAALYTNYPNPFNETTRISFRLHGGATRKVQLSVFDLLGREVAVLVDEKKAPGMYEVVFNATGLASGVYLCRLRAGDLVQTKRLMLAK
jgi:photosystem II stability/assembly factor-like uncharacterized protein